MPKVLVLYYSSYGHIETMAQAVAEGARGAGATVDIKRVPELVPDEVAKASHFKMNQAAPVATVATAYDASTVGHPLDGFGALMPRREGRRVLGVLFSSTMFDGRAPAGTRLYLMIGAQDKNTSQLRLLQDHAQTLLLLRLVGVEVRFFTEQGHQQFHELW